MIFRILVVLLLCAVFLYYATVAHHFWVNPIFGKLPLYKLVIPFYGWVYIFKNQNK